MEKKQSLNGVDFIDDAYLDNLAKNTAEDPGKVREIIAKSLSKEPLSVEETAALLAVESPDLLEEIFNAARQLKRDVYGNRIVLFAPLYIGNHCINDCKYCGFRRSLRTAVRRTLSEEDLKREVSALENEGHKRLILVYGEHPDYTPEFIARTTRICYETKVGNGEIRRVNINAAPLSVEGFRIVKEAGIGTFQIFQETYNKKAYALYHPEGTHKGDYMWRLSGMDRAFEGGCDDVGIGALFGLYDWRFEVLGLVTHAVYLKKNFGVGPHTISFPRIQAAHGLNFDLPYQTTDAEFKRLVAILRLAVPYTGLIMTARESAQIRDEVIEFGVSQIDAGTRLEIGSYQEKRGGQQKLEKEQFKIGDERQLDEVIRWLTGRDFVPSFCTSCYRLGRTGEHFMEYAIPGFIQRFCSPNAVLTLCEYLEDYASPETKAAGYQQIERELAKITNPGEKIKLIERLEKIKNGQRDLYF
ncbi:MAG: [FeFe] hydrogenase H-cluster radical SAM maturase HydG [Victivallaceae bacterium]|jgi:2-iminoacetate synthase|nr:[FeFe] hydrogenase H-cluster radical SAM maturase HydG [Victivallaceae bacterium]NLK83709.1 [FeFe] hydrogenase H-cluster radical SAM maturase HydG [Lentisphaerota bacterium]MDD3116245.1 [FeFe] hydrogenase H-cluster radical SAM maturase HydG [Victivallaceae bacterium]MDD3704074.1 [FeFe] hydrogenase H-cluster radical SAM maturase HydG [Victivallaceae bacterium]MDD4318325.1 [FeFe] hydrogenase H-cluster radical SAM maturase HydG [Victivallaceae bacterium]